MIDVIIRADASGSIGTGHIMRDLVLARQFAPDSVLFATRDLPGNMNERICKEGFAQHTLEQDGIDELIALVRREQAKTVVVDHYGIGYDDEKRLKESTGVTLLCLDDTYERHYCDIVLNHNINADAARYAGRVPAYCELRCGPRYTLLRDEFTALVPRARAINPEQINVFVAMGGADHANIARDVLQALLRHPAVHATVVTTSVNWHLDALRDFAAGQRRISLQIDADRIAERMNAADLAVVTPSVTANEVIYLELPFIAVQTADNQREMAEFLQRHGIAVLHRCDAGALDRQFDALINHYDDACRAVQRLKRGEV